VVKRVHCKGRKTQESSSAVRPGEEDTGKDKPPLQNSLPSKAGARMQERRIGTGPSKIR
jgi:hypothetical protein